MTIGRIMCAFGAHRWVYSIGGEIRYCRRKDCVHRQRLAHYSDGRHSWSEWKTLYPWPELHDAMKRAVHEANQSLEHRDRGGQ